MFEVLTYVHKMHISIYIYLFQDVAYVCLENVSVSVYFVTILLKKK
jgi:hypothetical protein